MVIVRYVESNIKSVGVWIGDVGDREVKNKNHEDYNFKDQSSRLQIDGRKGAGDE